MYGLPVTSKSLRMKEGLARFHSAKRCYNIRGVEIRRLVLWPCSRSRRQGCSARETCRGGLGAGRLPRFLCVACSSARKGGFGLIRLTEEDMGFPSFLLSSKQQPPSLLTGSNRTVPGAATATEIPTPTLTLAFHSDSCP